MILNNLQTAQALPYANLAIEIAQLLQDPSVHVPARMVQALPGGGSLFVMPAHDARIAITKLITYTPANALPANTAHGLPTIMGDVLLFDNATGQRLALLDGPTVTARRTAAVSLLAAQRLAAQPVGPLLIIGAGVQGRSHLEAFIQGLALGSNTTREILVYSRSASSAAQLVQYAQTLLAQHKLQGTASVVTDLAHALPRCTLVVTCTNAQGNVLHHPALLHPQAFVCAVGAFTPKMTELSPSVVQHFAAHGRIIVDTADAAHEAGDLIQAGIDINACATLQHIVQQPPVQRGLTLFKSCGWAGWDLAAARLVVAAKFNTDVTKN
jgi:1-piperideine-2-carboxylate/1-pyrroline-2-carboxylate reductase [NAD(P)H]